MKTKKDGIHQKSHQAIHWLREELLPGAKRPTLAIACGHQIEARLWEYKKAWEERTSVNTSAVTCRECRRLLRAAAGGST